MTTAADVISRTYAEVAEHVLMPIPGTLVVVIRDVSGTPQFMKRWLENVYAGNSFGALKSKK